jgi:hypothetical protein
VAKFSAGQRRPATLAPRVDAHVAAGFQPAGHRAQRRAVPIFHGEFEVLAARRRAEKARQQQQATHLESLPWPRQEGFGVGAIAARRVKAGAATGAEQHGQFVHERTAAVHLDGEVESLGLYFGQECRYLRQVRFTLRQTGVAGEFPEAVDVSRVAAGEFGRAG